MEPTTLLNLGYQSVNIAKAIAQYRAQLAVERTMNALTNMQDTLDSIEQVLHIQLLRPLRSAIAMLQDAEAEAYYDKQKSEELAKRALTDFNMAEGQVVDDENLMFSLIGKACVYRLLEMEGAYNRAAQEANTVFERIELIQKNYCPKGHGQLREWEGSLRCWKCGWPMKSI